MTSAASLITTIRAGMATLEPKENASAAPRKLNLNQDAKHAIWEARRESRQLLTQFQPGTDMAGAVSTLSTFKPKNLVLPCLISRCKEKSYVSPLVAPSPNSLAGLWTANATTAPAVKLPTARSTDSIRTVRANLGSKSTCVILPEKSVSGTTFCTVARR